MSKDNYFNKSGLETSKDDHLDPLKADFGQLFHESGLNAFTEAKGFGFIGMEGAEDGDNQSEFGIGSMNVKSGHTPIRTLLNPTMSPMNTNSHTRGYSNYGAMNSKQTFSQDSFGHNMDKTPVKFTQDHFGGGYDDYGEEQTLYAREYFDPYPDRLNQMWDDNGHRHGISNKNQTGTPGDSIHSKTHRKFIEKSKLKRRLYEDDDEIADQNDDRTAELMADNEGSRMSQQESGASNGIIHKTLVKEEYSRSNEEHHSARNPFSYDSQPETKTPTPRKSSKAAANTSVSKSSTQQKQQVFDDDDDDDGKNRSSRGLRVLSLKVKDIVCEKKKTSYKEVAETLIQDISHKLKSKGDANSKEEQNVKRRVYDALNVLIAADILKKEGKTVSCDDSVANLGAHRRKQMREEKDSLEKEIQEIRRRHRHKIEGLQELVFKTLAIKNLIARNQEREESESVLKKRKSNSGGEKKSNKKVKQSSQNTASDENDNKESSDGNEKIQFPFIVLITSSPENQMNLHMDTQKKKLAVESSHPISLFGDIDVLLKMRLHYVSKQLFDTNVPRELHKYIPKTYLEQLKLAV